MGGHMSLGSVMSLAFHLMSGHLTLHPTQLRQWWYNVVTTLVCAAPQPDCFTWRLQTQRHLWAQHDSECCWLIAWGWQHGSCWLLFQPGAKLAAASSLIQSWLASHRLRAEQPRREPARGRLQLNSGRCSTVINHHARDVTPDSEIYEGKTNLMYVCWNRTLQPLCFSSIFIVLAKVVLEN